MLPGDGPLAGDLREAGVDVRLEVEDLGPLPAAVHAAGYRIVQESLTNVLRHARASRAEVLVAREGGDVRVEVTDDGRRPVLTGGEGHGLIGMRERVALHGGEFSAGPRSDGGFAVTASLPYRVAA